MDARVIVNKLLEGGDGLPDEGIPNLSHYASGTPDYWTEQAKRLGYKVDFVKDPRSGFWNVVKPISIDSQRFFLNCSELSVRDDLLSLSVWRQEDSGDIQGSGVIFPKNEFSRVAVAAEQAFKSIRRQSKLNWNTSFGPIEMTTLDQVIIMVRQKLEQRFPWPDRDFFFR